MKNRLIPICAVLLALALLFAGCGASSNGGAKRQDYATPEAAPGYGYVSDSSNYYDDYDYPDVPSYENEGKTGSSSLGELTEGMMNANANSEFDKIIYTANVDLETLEFEETISALYKLIEANGAFIETSSVSGTNYNAKYYYGYSSYRTAYFTIRVPKENFSGLTGALSSIGNVTQSRTSADNITASFLDTESRLKAYRTEESNLLEMMEKADTVEDMITIQDRLSWIRYEIESLTSQLKNWQNRVDYSTLNLNITEVKEYTEEPVIEKTFGEEIRDGFNSSVKWLKQALRDIVVFIVSSLPVLVLPIIILIPAAIILIIVLLSVKSRKKKKARKAEAESK